jgi:hypothetical protein
VLPNGSVVFILFYFFHQNKFHGKCDRSIPGINCITLLHSAGGFRDNKTNLGVDRARVFNQFKIFNRSDFFYKGFSFFSI